MEVLPDFALLKPASIDEAVGFARSHNGARYLAGGTDLIVNLRRGIGEASALIDLSGVADLNLLSEVDGGLRIGAGMRLADLQGHETVARRYPVLAQAAGEIAGPTHRRFATVGGNLCLDTRCIYYNQSHWWRHSNDYCLKYKGEICHVAPKSKICFAAFSGDLAPALLILGAEIEIAGPDGTRRMALNDLYTDDGAAPFTLGAGEFVTAALVPPEPVGSASYSKVRVRESIEFPLVGVAVCLNREGPSLASLAVAMTGTNARPLLIEGLDEACGGPLDDDAIEKITRLCNKQIQPMKSTASPSTYRRAVAVKLAISETGKLWEAADG
jgi:4-hydroxybenzoyl-CoA reductase subunit beta